MATYTDAQMLEAVREAIHSLIASGKPYIQATIGGREVRFYSLADLQNLEKYYQRRVDAASTNSGSYRPLKTLGIRPCKPQPSS